MTLKKMGYALTFAALSTSLPLQAHEAGDMILRVGATAVDPQESSGAATLDGSVLSLAGGNSSLGLDSNTQLGLTFNYMLSSSWSLELLAATPFKHTATGKGELEGLDIADTKHLPPTLSAVYHFPESKGLQAYVGAGINYTTFFEDDITPAADATLADLGLTGASVDIDDSFGLALQAGVDYHLNAQWLLNASIRWIDIDTDAEISFDNGSKLAVDLDIDPLVYTLAVGYKF